MYGSGSNLVRSRWIVGADGTHSRVRKWAGLDENTGHQQRFAFRRHYRVTPWTSCMELYWGNNCQLYVTPVAANEICVAAISRDPGLRLDGALARFPVVAESPRRFGADLSREGRDLGNAKIAAAFIGVEPLLLAMLPAASTRSPVKGSASHFARPSFCSESFAAEKPGALSGQTPEVGKTPRCNVLAYAHS